MVTRALAGTADEMALAGIDSASFATTTLDAKEELARPWVHAWLARPDSGTNAVPAAFLLAWLVADELHILSIATLPASRRQGAGRALLGTALGFAREKKVRLLLLE